MLSYRFSDGHGFHFIFIYVEKVYLYVYVFLDFISEGNNVFDILSAFRAMQPLQNDASTLKGKTCSKSSKFFDLEVDPY